MAGTANTNTETELMRNVGKLVDMKRILVRISFIISRNMILSLLRMCACMSGYQILQYYCKFKNIGIQTLEMARSILIRKHSNYFHKWTISSFSRLYCPLFHSISCPVIPERSVETRVSTCLVFQRLW